MITQFKKLAEDLFINIFPYINTIYKVVISYIRVKGDNQRCHSDQRYFVSRSSAPQDDPIQFYKIVKGQIES